MEKIAYVKLDVNEIMKIISFTVRLKNMGKNYDAYAFRQLLNVSISLLKIAERYGGLPIPLMGKPNRKKGQFVYFQVIFRNKANMKTFLKAIENRSFY